MKNSSILHEVGYLGHIFRSRSFTENNQYAPIKNMVEAMGAKYEWNSKTNTINILTKTTDIINYPQKVDALMPQLSVSKLKIDPSIIDAYKFEKKGEKIDVQLEIEEGLININYDTWLDYNSDYTLKLFMEDGSRKIINFKTSGLPVLALGYQRKIIFVPAMPDKGFNYPYYLVLPKKINVDMNKAKRITCSLNPIILAG